MISDEQLDELEKEAKKNVRDCIDNRQPQGVKEYTEKLNLIQALRIERADKKKYE